MKNAMILMIMGVLAIGSYILVGNCQVEQRAETVQRIEVVETINVEVEEVIVVAPETKVEDVRVVRTLSSEDFNLLCDLVMAEAENQSFEAQHLVACVVLNRVDSELFPSSLTTVIHQSNQFSCIRDGRFQKVSGNPSESVVSAVEYALEYNPLPKNVLYFTSNGYLTNTVPYDIVDEMYFSSQK